MRQRIIYYRDEVNDDFAGTNIKTKPLRENYRYIRESAVWKTASFVLYRVIAQPLVFLFVKTVYRQRFENKEVLKDAGGAGMYVYSNHTHKLLDAFIPSMLRYRGRGYIIVGPDAMSIPGLKNIVQMLGAIPLGSTFTQSKEMLGCARTRIKQKNHVVIYPEAHIWPYYTEIRPFPPMSFGYPAHDGAPVYAMTNCYKKRRLVRLPKVVTYLDGPFYADYSLSLSDRREKLMEQCRCAMQKRAEENSDYQYVVYKKAQ